MVEENPSKRPVLLLRDPCENDSLRQQSLALCGVHDHPVDENATWDDVVEVDLIGRESNGLWTRQCRWNEFGPSADDRFEHPTNFEITDDLRDVDRLDIPVGRRRAYRLSASEQLATSFNR